MQTELAQKVSTRKQHRNVRKAFFMFPFPLRANKRNISISWAMLKNNLFQSLAFNHSRAASKTGSHGVDKGGV